MSDVLCCRPLTYRRCRMLRLMTAQVRLPCRELAPMDTLSRESRRVHLLAAATCRPLSMVTNRRESTSSPSSRRRCRMVTLLPSRKIHHELSRPRLMPRSHPTSRSKPPFHRNLPTGEGFLAMAAVSFLDWRPVLIFVHSFLYRQNFPVLALCSFCHLLPFTSGPVSM